MAYSFWNQPEPPRGGWLRLAIACAALLGAAVLGIGLSWLTGSQEARVCIANTLWLAGPPC